MTTSLLHHNDQFPCGSILFHGAMGFLDVLKGTSSIDLDYSSALFKIVEVGLKGITIQVFSISGVHREPDRMWDVLHGCTGLQISALSKHFGHAHDPSGSTDL